MLTCQHRSVKYFFWSKCAAADITAGIYLPKVRNRNSKTRCEYCLSGFFIVNFEYVIQYLLVLLLIHFSMQIPTGLFNKIVKAWVWVEILCLDFPKIWGNQYITSSKVATFENCEIILFLIRAGLQSRFEGRQ